MNHRFIIKVVNCLGFFLHVKNIRELKFSKICCGCEGLISDAFFYFKFRSSGKSLKIDTISL